MWRILPALIAAVGLPGCGEIVSAPSSGGAGYVDALHLEPSGDVIPVRVGEGFELTARLGRTCFDRIQYSFGGRSGEIDLSDIRCERAGRCSVIDNVVTSGGRRVMTVGLADVQSVSVRVTGISPGSEGVLIHVMRAAELGDRPEPSTCGYSFGGVSVRILP
jgi:hypothetical protein